MPDALHLTMSCIAKHGVVSLSFFLFLLLSPTLSTAQPNTQQPNANDGYPYARFSPSMAIIIVVLVAALFFMGLFSIYIRNCSESNGSTVRPVAGGTGRSRRGTHGLEASVIETFPTMVYSEVKDHKIGKGALECAVCLNEFEDDETLRLIPKCDHVFHPDCIDAWLASHTTCPVCRANLAPQPGDPVSQPTELDSATTIEVDIEAPSTAGESETEEEGRRNANCDVEAQVPPPDVEVISLNQTLNRNRTRGSRSSRTRRLFFPRSHSTGHSLVQPGENTDRFTLRLPADVRKQLMKRELNRTMSMVVLPRERSSRRGFRGGEDGGSNRGGRSFKRLDKLDQGAKSDRWVFTMAPPFFSRASSMKSPRVAADDGEGTSSRPVGPAGESSRPPV